MEELKKMQNFIKFAHIKGEPRRITVEYATSFARHGKRDFNELEDALESAIAFVEKYQKEGESGGCWIYLYKPDGHGWICELSALVQSNTTGKYYPNGYAIPCEGYVIKEFDF